MKSQREKNVQMAPKILGRWVLKRPNSDWNSARPDNHWASTRPKSTAHYPAFASSTSWSWSVQPPASPKSSTLPIPTLTAPSLGSDLILQFVRPRLSVSRHVSDPSSRDLLNSFGISVACCISRLAPPRARLVYFFLWVAVSFDSNWVELARDAGPGLAPKDSSACELEACAAD
jgi:hypothetical protein